MKKTLFTGLQTKLGQFGRSQKKAGSKPQAIQAAFCMLLLFCGPANAQDNALHLFENWKQDLESTGASVDTGTVDYDSVADQLTVQELSISFSNKYDISDSANRYGLNKDKHADLFDMGIGIGFELSAVKMVMVGLNSADDVTSIERTEFPKDLEIKLNLDFWDDGNLAISSSFAGFNLENATNSKPNHTIAKGFGSELGWSQIIDYVGFDSFDAGKAEKVRYNIEFNMQEERVFDLTGEYTNFDLQNFEDSIIQSFMADSHERNFNYTSEEDETQENESSTSERLRIQNFNLSSIFELFDSPNKRSDDRVQVFEESNANQYSASSESATSRIDSYDIRNLKWSLQNLDVLGICSMFLMDIPIESVSLSVDLIRIFHATELGEWAIKGIDSEETIEEDDGEVYATTYSIDEIKLKNLSGNGLGELSVSNLKSESDTENDWLKIGGLAFNEVKFAEFKEIRDILNEVETEDSFPDDPVTTAKIFLPRSLAFNVKDMEFNTAGDENTPKFNFKIGSLSKSFNSKVPPIPTDIAFEGNGIELQVDELESTNLVTFLRNMAVDTISMSYKGRLYWNEETEELILEGLNFDVSNMGEIEASARLSGLKRSVLENPDILQLSMAAFSFDYVKLKFIEKGIVQQFVKTSAANSNVPNSQAVEILTAVVKEEIAELIGAEFAEHVEAELNKFLLDPKTLTLDMSPEKPINILALLASAAIPSTIPGLLNAEVKANQ